MQTSFEVDGLKDRDPDLPVFRQSTVAGMSVVPYTVVPPAIYYNVLFKPTLTKLKNFMS
jgi:hypothetical protein